MSLRNLLLVLIAAILVAGCQARAVKSIQAQQAVELSWNHQPLTEAPGDFHFAIVSDNAGGMRPGIFKDAVDKLNLLRPTFVMCVGDLVEGYAEKEDECRTQYDEFSGIIDALDAPFFGTAGNHDDYSEVMRTYVTNRYGRLYYAFVYQDVLFLVLDTQDDQTNSNEHAGLSDAQVEFAARTLAAHPRARWTFVFMHQPFFAGPEYKDVKGWDKIEAALANRPHTVFAGHWHEYAKHTVNGSAYYRLATTGGDTRLNGADQGSFDEIVWVTMTKKGPKIANLDLTGIYRDDVATDQTSLAYQSITDCTVVKAASPAIESTTFTSGVAKVELKNDTDFPLSLKASIESSEPLAVTPASIETNVKPHTVETVDLTLSVAQPTAPSAVVPAVVRWSASYDVPGRKPIAGTGSSAIVLEGTHYCRTAATAVSIDGDLSEWASLDESLSAPMQFTANPALWTGPADASAKFAVTHDDKFVYLAFAVTDDRVVVDNDHKPRQEDCLSVYIDARPADARSTKTDKYSAAFFIAPGTAAGREALGDPLPEGARAASVITPTGYNTEIAVPIELLNQAAGGESKDFRLNVRLHDLDTTQWDATLMWWRPVWYGATDCPGSGTFVKE